MSRDELLIELDKCFGIKEQSNIVRWCKCVLLCDWLFMHDTDKTLEERENLYATRLCYSRFVVGISVLTEDGVKETEDSTNYNTLLGADAREQLNLTRTTKKDIGRAETIILDDFSEVDSSTILGKLIGMGTAGLGRKKSREISKFLLN